MLCLVKVQRVYWLGATMNSTRTLSVGKVERGPTVYIMTATNVLFCLKANMSSAGVSITG